MKACVKNGANLKEFYDFLKECIGKNGVLLDISENIKDEEDKVIGLESHIKEPEEYRHIGFNLEKKSHMLTHKTELHLVGDAPDIIKDYLKDCIRDYAHTYNYKYEIFG